MVLRLQRITIKSFINEFQSMISIQETNIRQEWS